jgi:glycerol-3-phosphate acyltransferase PlsY
VPGIAWFLISFLAGSIPFATILGRLFLRKDITAAGDGNPGGVNVAKSGSLALGVIVILLDGFKAAIPVGLAYHTGDLPFGWMVAVALAPLLGHAYSPFLKGKGGKSIASSFGIWTGITIWEIPSVMGVQAVLFTLLFGSNGWSILFTMLGSGLYLLIFRRDPLLMVIWLGNLLLLLIRLRHDLLDPPRLSRRFQRRSPPRMPNGAH